MSADYGTVHFKAYLHEQPPVPYLHVTHREDGEPALGNFARAGLKLQLVRRTIVIHDEEILPEEAGDGR